MRTIRHRKRLELSARDRRRGAAAGAALVLALAACGDDADLDPVDGDPAPIDEDHDPDEPADDEAAIGENGPDEDGEGDEVERLSGEPTTEEASAEADRGRLAVTDVRVSSHDGFDRIVLEVDGDGEVGYRIGYADGGTATSQGSGEPIEVAGQQALGIGLHGMTYPGDEPEGVTRWDGDHVEGVEGGLVHEVVEDTVFEGIHTFVAGLDEPYPYVVEVLEDPDRVVIDVVHDG